MMHVLTTRLLLICLIGLSQAKLFAANPHSSDFELLTAKHSLNEPVLKSNKKFMQSRSHCFVVKYNPVRLSLGALMYVYQNVVSPQLPSQCLYVESCSQFSKSMIYDFGLLKGMFTTSDRLMRCNRVSALDVHPLMIDEKLGKVVESTEIYRKQP